MQYFLSFSLDLSIYVVNPPHHPFSFPFPSLKDSKQLIIIVLSTLGKDEAIHLKHEMGDDSGG